MLLPDIRDISCAQLKDFLQQHQASAFREKQLGEWLYQKGASDFSVMKNLPLALRLELAEHFVIRTPELLERRVSSDGTQKFLLALSDEARIEAVLIPAARRSTVCLSSQVGCKFACRFCASGIGGWKRNLLCSEMISQLLSVKKHADNQEISHVVLMGTGEPLDNYEQVLKAVRLMNAPIGLGIGARRITISTCGLVPEIQRLAGEGLQIELSVSLHGYNEQTRGRLMPVNQRYPLSELMAACRAYTRRTKRQITFEYILIQGLTCTPEAAGALKRLFKGVIAKLNLIPYNRVTEFSFQPPSPFAVKKFRESLSKEGIPTTFRMSRGEDAAAACGQLRAMYQKSGPRQGFETAEERGEE